MAGRTLITNWYPAQTPQRQLENEYCLWKNIQSKQFSKIVLVNRGPIPKWVYAPQVTCLPVSFYPTFDTLFGIAQGYPPGVFVVANTDIFFDDTIREADNMGVGEVFCVSRFERVKRRWELYRNHKCSQDTWIFKNRSIADKIFCNFRMGTLGCDNRLAWELDNAGYQVSNPALKLHTHHVHFSQQRYMDRKNTNDVVPPPYKLVSAL